MKRITQEQLAASVPLYVERALIATRSIVERALEDPTSGIQIHAPHLIKGDLQSRPLPGSYDEITKFKKSQQNSSKVELDVQLDNSRLAILRWGVGGAAVRAWRYNVPSPQADVEAAFSRDIPKELPRTRPETTWRVDKARNDSAQLVPPAFIFHKPPGLENPRWDILAYTDSVQGELVTRETAHIYEHEGTLDSRMSAYDQQLINTYGLPAFHAHKIEELLGIMEHIA